MGGLFVTGTDTSIGKTFVSCAILRALARRGHRVGVYKPAETGCPTGPSGMLQGEDCARLAAAAAADQPAASVSTALYRIPAAPLVSAEAEGRAIDPESLLRGCAAVSAAHAAVLVEGAGGLLVPIAPAFSYAELAARLALPVVLVVGSKLGCLNHALLTLSELERRGLPVVGYVLNELAPEQDGGEFAHAVATNRETLARLTESRDLGLLPFVPAAERDDFDALADRAETHLDLGAIACAMGL